MVKQILRKMTNTKLKLNTPETTPCSIVGWGHSDAWDQTTPPADNDYVALAAGGAHSLALKADGSIVGCGYCYLALFEDGSKFGWESEGEALWNSTGTLATCRYRESAPLGNDFVAIAAGPEHSLALKSDGSIVGWGLEGSDVGMPDVGGYGIEPVTPPPGKDYVAIAAGDGYSLALKADGSIVGWGYNAYRQANAPAGNDYVAIAAGGYHSLALKADGSIVGWGNNDHGQASPPRGKGYVAIVAAGGWSLALKADGSIVGWGEGDRGQATPPPGDDHVAIAAGNVHSLALKADGSIVGWREGDRGQATPPAGNDYVAIAAGDAHSLALKADIKPKSATSVET